MVSLFKRSDKTSSRQLKKYYRTVDRINSLESVYAEKSDSELQQVTAQFREMLDEGKELEDIIPDAFAAVREASKRVLNMRHFDVQLIGGLVLTEGNIAEMPTGEGKTLVSSLPAYVRALTGKGVHIITVNDYLAQRDFRQIGKIHQFLGLTVGLNLPQMDTKAKKKAYAADITYGVGSEFGFDYLRDNMAGSNSDKVQRPYHYAIIDEVDSVLIDEAKTPLIVAGKMAGNTDLHNVASLLARRFKEGRDYEFDSETKATSLTDTGIEKVEKAFDVENLYELEHQTLYHYVIQAVRAHVMFERDVDYIVKDGKVMLIDMFTGRAMEGRTLSEGLHQAIEAKEKLEITEENKAQAQITIQNYFRMYPILSGMTGTAKTQEKEFREVYDMEVIQVPTNKPVIREDMPDRFFETTAQKYREVAKEAAERRRKGQPVLIGTTSIIQSEEVARFLREEGLSFQLLNAKSVEQEVELISQAGQPGNITVATNMAGRGTDIVLGEGVRTLGGLHVIGTEKHESRRIDNQLRGRSGRQGDPGSSQFIISLEDDMFRRFAEEDTDKFKKKNVADEAGEYRGKAVQELSDRTQRIVEGAHFSMREYNLKLDDVINEQRKIVYDLRDRVLNGDENGYLLKTMLENTVKFVFDETLPPDGLIEPEHITTAEMGLQEVFGESFRLPSGIDKRKEAEAQTAKPLAEAEKLIDGQIEHPRVNAVTTQVLQTYADQMWVKHLESMSHLKEGIGLRMYQQEDPMRIYQREGLELFTMNFQEMRVKAVTELLSFMRLRKAEQEEAQ